MNEKLWKIQGGACIYETAHILVAKCPRVQNLVKINAKTRHAYKMIQYANNLIHIVNNIDENMRNSRKNEGK